jgi:hypothetical protein
MDKSVYNELKDLIGIDMNIAMPIFLKYVKFEIRGYNKDFGGFPEELVAFRLKLNRPTTKKGPDFDELGDCKAVAGKILSKPVLDSSQKLSLITLGLDPKDCLTTLRNCGNPPIANLEKISDFFRTNLWNKIRRVIFIYHVDGKIIDIRIFDGEKYKYVLENDYNLINQDKRDETKILALKLKTGSVQIKKTMDIFLSESISSDVDNNIDNQEEYINKLFSENLSNYRETTPKPNFNNIKDFVGMYANFSELAILEEIIKNRRKEISESMNFLIEDNLPF